MAELVPGENIVPTAKGITIIPERCVGQWTTPRHRYIGRCRAAVMKTIKAKAIRPGSNKYSSVRHLSLSKSDSGTPDSTLMKLKVCSRNHRKRKNYTGEQNLESSD